MFFIVLTTTADATTYSIDFDGDDNGVQMATGIFPTGNFLDTNGNLFFSEGNSYIEHGFEHNAIAFINQNFGSHVHATGNLYDFSTASNLSNDAGGAFLRKKDGGLFSLNSWEFVSLTTVVEDELFNLNPSLFNPAPESHLVIQGSLNGIEQFTLDIFDTTTSLGSFNFQTATNGASNNIDLVEYWFSGTGRGVIPLRDHVQIGVVIDNIVVTSVPIPATFYLFFSSLVGLLGLSKNAAKIPLTEVKQEI